MRFFIIYLLLMLLSALFLFSCTPAKRLSKILKENPNLIETNDTTIYLKTVNVDTTFIFNKISNVDTFYIKDIKTKIYRFYDTLRVETENTTDSIIIKTHTIKMIPEQKNKEQENKKIFNKIVVILSFFVVIMALYVFRNIFK